jgi:hypothetical protein
MCVFCFFVVVEDFGFVALMVSACLYLFISYLSGLCESGILPNL